MNAPPRRTVARKMGIAPGLRAHLVGAPEDALAALELPELRHSAALTERFDYIHVFAWQQAELEQLLRRTCPHLAPKGALWVSWPKGRQCGTDLTLPEVIRIGYAQGLVESKTLRVDARWSAMRFTHPKPGKVYRNSYGTLPGSGG